MLFAKANVENCVAIREVLHNFCSLSGQSVSKAKSRIYFSPNIDPSDKEALSDILGFQQTECLEEVLRFSYQAQRKQQSRF